MFCDCCDKSKRVNYKNEMLIKTTPNLVNRVYCDVRVRELVYVKNANRVRIQIFIRLIL